MNSCSVSELKAFLQKDPNLLLIDCRRLEEYESGHVPGAKLITLGEDLAAHQWPKDQPIYVICHSGGRSAAFCQELKHLGLDNAVNVEGGTSAWVREGHEIKS